MKALFYILTLMVFFQCLPLISEAQETIEQTKANYEKAKLEIEDMLSGKEPLSYERSIFLLENAYRNEKVSFESFQNDISSNVTNIVTLINRNKYSGSDKKPENFYEALKKKSNDDADYLGKAKINYAIYTYMSDSTYYYDTSKSEVVDHWPYRYSKSDPLGTNDWTNTQVSNLMSNGTGNCFALASLFKIYSERLNSEANICTAPGHVYISHRDENGTKYNVEIASKAFPGTGTLSTLTHTTKTAIENDISLRELDLKQSVALCLVYLAKGYEHKTNLANDVGFMMACADVALKYDSLNLSAMLLKAEILEHGIIRSGKSIAQLESEESFINYNKLIGHLFRLGYLEMPLDMKNKLLKGWSKDTVSSLASKSYLPTQKGLIIPNQTRYASLSWGLFDEEMIAKPVERFGQTLFNTKQHKIVGFAKEETLYNNYNFDPVLFALSIDPLAAKYPSISPYAAFANNPIRYIDKDGAEPGDVVVAFGGGDWQMSNDKGRATNIIQKVNANYISKYGGQAQAFASKFWNVSPDNKNDLNKATQAAYDFVLANYNKQGGKDVKGGKIVIEGYSMGGVMANYLATRLGEKGVTVDLLVTVDEAAAWKTDDVDRSVSSNVKKNINIYQTNKSSVGSHGGKNTAEGKNTVIENDNYSNYYEGTPGEKDYQQVEHGTIDDMSEGRVVNEVVNTLGAKR